MPSTDQYPPEVPYRPPRPRGEGLAGTIGLALLGLIVTANPLGALAGGAVGNTLDNQAQPLEAALRTYFTQRNLSFVGFYRLGPRAAKVLFNHLDQFWIVTSHAPDSTHWTTESIDDWLYGDLVQNLETKLSEITAGFTG
jgi:hypothetical protein